MEWAHRHASLTRTLAAIQRHQQGHHGWRDLHEALEHLHATGHPELHSILRFCWTSRPHISDAHLITLLGIAVRDLSLRLPPVSQVFEHALPAGRRRQVLADVVTAHHDELSAAVADHSNSFTGARRFLLPQVILGAYALAHGLAEVRFLDLGTGLGVLPRQLNHPEVFDHFAAGLRWTGPGLPYVEIPLALRHGVDAHPLPTLDWVRSCYGPSAYYDTRFDELVWSLDRTGDADVVIEPLNLLDLPELRRYLQRHRFNVITCNFVLYQYDEATRAGIVRTIVEQLAAPGLLLSMEPSHGLLRQGCRVEAYLPGVHSPLHVAEVSDAHFIGDVTLTPEGGRLLEVSTRRFG